MLSLATVSGALLLVASSWCARCGIHVLVCCALWQTLGALFGYRIGWMLFVASYRCAYGIRCVSALLIVASMLRNVAISRCSFRRPLLVRCSLWQATGERCGSRCISALLVVASNRCALWRPVY